MSRLTRRVKIAKHRARVTNSARKRRVTRGINQWFENVVTKAKDDNATDAAKQLAARVIVEKANRVAKNKRIHHPNQQQKLEAKVKATANEVVEAAFKESN
jgi:hypothetical protein